MTLTSYKDKSEFLMFRKNATKISQFYLRALILFGSLFYQDNKEQKNGKRETPQYITNIDLDNLVIGTAYNHTS